MQRSLSTYIYNCRVWYNGIIFYTVPIHICVLYRSAQVQYNIIYYYYMCVLYSFVVCLQERKPFSDEEEIAVTTNHRSHRHCRHAQVSPTPLR